jgi:hypothetical protein
VRRLDARTGAGCSGDAGHRRRHSEWSARTATTARSPISLGKGRRTTALLSEGYAKVLTIPPNDRYESTFEKAEREAKDTDAGLWSTCDRDRIEARSAAARRKTRRERAAARRRVGRAEGVERLGYVPMHGWF